MSLADKELSAREVKFIEEWFANGGNATAAAISAGITKSTNSAKVRANELLKQNPNCQEALKAIRAAAMKKAEYTAEKALKECEEGMKLANATRNAMALAKLIELRAKLMGLLIEKIDVRSIGNFSIHISGIAPSKPQVLISTPINPPLLQAVDEDEVLK